MQKPLWAVQIRKAPARSTLELTEDEDGLDGLAASEGKDLNVNVSIDEHDELLSNQSRFVQSCSSVNEDGIDFFRLCRGLAANSEEQDPQSRYLPGVIVLLRRCGGYQGAGLSTERTCEVRVDANQPCTGNGQGTSLEELFVSRLGASTSVKDRSSVQAGRTKYWVILRVSIRVSRR